MKKVSSKKDNGLRIQGPYVYMYEDGKAVFTAKTDDISAFLEWVSPAKKIFDELAKFFKSLWKTLSSKLRDIYRGRYSPSLKILGWA